MGYEAEHASALKDVTKAGAAVTFTEDNPTYDPATDQLTSPVTNSIAGFAVRVQGDPKVYERLGLVETEAPTLLFVPTTFGDTPDIGMQVTFGGVEFTSRSVAPLAPDGTTILARIVIAR